MDDLLRDSLRIETEVRDKTFGIVDIPEVGKLKGSELRQRVSLYQSLAPGKRDEVILLLKYSLYTHSFRVATNFISVLGIRYLLDSSV